MTDFTGEPSTLPATQARLLLEELSTWGKTTTIIIHGGCVFEFKGSFPRGAMGEGFYNLGPNPSGFEGHIDLGRLSAIRLQSRLHRGRESHAFVFVDVDDKPIFKVFVGREANGELIASQLARFKSIAARQSLGATTAGAEQ